MFSPLVVVIGLGILLGIILSALDENGLLSIWLEEEIKPDVSETEKTLPKGKVKKTNVLRK